MSRGTTRSWLLVLMLMAAAFQPLTSPGAASAQAGVDEASPNTLFVRPDGNDAANGRTVATAWRSLQGALARVQPGQSLYVLNGTYQQARCSHCGSHFRLAPADNGRQPRADAPIRILAYPGHNPIIRATTGTAIEVVGSHLELSGFTIRGEGFSATNNWGFGIMAETGQNIRLTNNTISGVPKAGIVGLHTSGLTIANNTVFNTSLWSPDADSGISILWPRNLGVTPGADGYHDRVINNVVFGNENRVPTPSYAPPGLVSDGNGIIIDQTTTTGYTGRILVMNNLAVNNGGKGINVFMSRNVDVLHNTLHRNGFTSNMWGDNGDISVGRSNNIRVLNNVAEARPDRRTYLTNDSTNVEISGNVSTGGLALRAPLGSTNTVTTGTAGYLNPTLDPRSGDFRLAATSPAVDRGVAITLPITGDRHGQARPVGPALDAGAHERQAVAPPTTTPPSPSPSPGVPTPPPANRTSSNVAASGHRSPAVGIAAGADGSGYVVAHADGKVTTVQARHHGDLSGRRLNQPIVGVTATASGAGYWLIAADGGVFSFGDARFHGSMGSVRLHAPVLSLTPTPTGGGYWLLAGDGGVFSFGDARFHGSMGGFRLNAPINGMTASPSGHGYRMVAADGGVFSFGDAPFHGSAGAKALRSPAVAMAPSPGNTGYWVLQRDGSLLAFGSAPHLGDAAGRSAVSLVAHPSAAGYRILLADGSTVGYGTAP
jgi:hypothetical protein